MNTQRQELIKKLYDALKRGEISRGNRLFSERELVEKMKVKRSLLREALIALDTLGIIDIRERQGVFVGQSGVALVADSLDFLSSFSPVYVIDQIYEVRLMIETAAAALAAERCSERDKALLQVELDYLEDYIAGEMDAAKAMQMFHHNVTLHNILVGAASNLVLQEIFKGVSALSRNAFTMLGHETINFHPYLLWPQQLYREHRAIIIAVTEKQPDDAYAAMETHLRNSAVRNRQTLSEMLDRPGYRAALTEQVLPS